jgi:hypothetical protein
VARARWAISFVPEEEHPQVRRYRSERGIELFLPEAQAQALQKLCEQEEKDPRGRGLRLDAMAIGTALKAALDSGEGHTCS